MKSNEIESDQMKSNQIKWNRIKSNQIKSNQIKSNWNTSFYALYSVPDIIFCTKSKSIHSCIESQVLFIHSITQFHLKQLFFQTNANGCYSLTNISSVSSSGSLNGSSGSGKGKKTNLVKPPYSYIALITMSILQSPQVSSSPYLVIDNVGECDFR